jgi:hypothetical protein
VITCLKACGRGVILEPITLSAEAGDIAAAEKVPMLEPAFNWGSSSTIAVDEDNVSDTTMTSQDSNPSVTAAQTKCDMRMTVGQQTELVARRYPNAWRMAHECGTRCGRSMCHYYVHLYSVAQVIPERQARLLLW